MNSERRLTPETREVSDAATLLAPVTVPHPLRSLEGLTYGKFLAPSAWQLWKRLCGTLRVG